MERTPKQIYAINAQIRAEIEFRLKNDTGLARIFAREIVVLQALLSGQVKYNELRFSRRSFFRFMLLVSVVIPGGFALLGCAAPPSYSSDQSEDEFESFSGGAVSSYQIEAMSTVEPITPIPYNLNGRTFSIPDNLDDTYTLPGYNSSGEIRDFVPIIVRNNPELNADVVALRDDATAPYWLNPQDIGLINQEIDKAVTEGKIDPNSTDFIQYKSWIKDLGESIDNDWSSWEQPIMFAGVLSTNFLGGELWKHVLSRLTGDRYACSRSEKKTLDHNVAVISVVLAAFFGMLSAEQLAGGAMRYVTAEIVRPEGIINCLHLFIDKAALEAFLAKIGTSLSEVGLANLATTSQNQLVMRFWLPATEGLKPSFHFLSKPGAIAMLAEKMQNPTQYGWRLITGTASGATVKELFRKVWLSSLRKGRLPEDEAALCKVLTNPKRWNAFGKVFLPNGEREEELKVVKVPLNTQTQGYYAPFVPGGQLIVTNESGDSSGQYGLALWMENDPKDVGLLFVEHIDTPTITTAVECTDLTTIGVLP